jgi:hypothetical protein
VVKRQSNIAPKNFHNRQGVKQSRHTRGWRSKCPEAAGEQSPRTVPVQQSPVSYSLMPQIF